MNDLDTRRYEMFVRVREFGAAHAAQFPAHTLGGELFARLNTIVNELDEHASEQVSGISSAQQSTTSKASARDELRQDLEAITRTARAMALSSPGLEDKFRAPRKSSDQVFLSVARAFAADVEPLKAEFVRRGMPANFVEDLQTDIGQFEAAIQRQIQNRGAHVAATAAIDENIERGTDTTRELDAIVRNTFAADPATIAAWSSASHIIRPAHTSRQRRTDAPKPAPSQRV